MCSSTLPHRPALISSRGMRLVLQICLAPLLRLATGVAAPLALLGSAFKRLQFFFPAKGREREDRYYERWGVSAAGKPHVGCAPRRSHVRSHSGVHLQGRLWQLETNQRWLKSSWSHPPLARAGLVLSGDFKGFVLALSSPREGPHCSLWAHALTPVLSSHA